MVRLSNFVGVSALAATASAYSLSNGTVTATEESTTLLTITSCSDHVCTETAVPGKHTLTTVTVEGVETAYTTVCPLSEESSTAAPASSPAKTAPASSAPAPSSEAPAVTSSEEGTSTQYITTQITVTQCSDNICSTSVVSSTEDVESTVTDEVVETGFTTVCPLSESSAPASSAPTSKAPAPAPTTEVPTSKAPTTEAPTSKAPTTEAPAPTSEAPAPAPSPFTNSTSAFTNSTTLAPVASSAAEDTTSSSTELVYSTLSQSSVASNPISTYEGAANIIGSSAFALALIPIAYLI